MSKRFRVPAISRGFTLVELLVVIAIIGILSSVVLASLNTAQSKAADASIKADMNTIRTQAQLFYVTNTNFTNVCADPVIVSAITQTNALSTGAGNCYSSATAWAFASPLKQGGFWCVDSNNVGRSKHASGNDYTGITTGEYPALVSSVATACN